MCICGFSFWGDAGDETFSDRDHTCTTVDDINPALP